MDSNQIKMYEQKLSNIIDTLFTRTISGTTIESKNLDTYHSLVDKLSRLIMEIADQVAIERCSKLNKATLEAFTKMEADIDKRFEQLTPKQDTNTDL